MKTRSDKKEIDVEKARRLYFEEQFSLNEVAERLDIEISGYTVGERLREKDYDLRTRGKIDLDVEKIKEMHHEKDMHTTEIAEELDKDVSHTTVRKRLKENGIEVRSQKEAVRKSNTKPYATYTEVHGYRVWQDSISDERVRVHRLLAVAEYGFDALKGKDVHHKNGIRWDNRPDNIELLEHDEHMIKHGTPTEELLEDIRRVARKLDKIPTVFEYREHGKHSDSSQKRRFGSWAEARNKALDRDDDVGNRMSSEKYKEKPGV